MCIVIIVYIISVNLSVLGWCDWRTPIKEDLTFLGRVRGGGGEGSKAKERLMWTWRYLKASVWNLEIP